MLSIPDMAFLGVAALLLFGPEQLPRVARKAGNVMRDIQNTSQSFIREMERAADLQDETAAGKPAEVTPYDPVPYGTQSYDTVDEPLPLVYDDPHAQAGEDAAAAPVGEKLAEPRPAPGAEPSPAAEPAPQSDHAPHL